MKATTAMLMIAAGTAFAATEIHVAVSGHDANPGTREAPVATLKRARDLVRALKADAGMPDGGVTVWVHPGTYELQDTLELGPDDSGQPDAPMVYRGVERRGTRLSGGRRLPPAAFARVTDAAVLRRVDPSVRGRLLVCDLKALGMTEYGEVSRAAFNGGPMLELFIDGRAMPLARWPNQREWATYGKVIDSGSIPRWNEKPDRPGTLEYVGDRPARWTQADDIWLHGYWAFDWYDDVLKVQRLDTETRRITFTTPHTYGLKAGRRYCAINLLEEIDAPGEWMLDRTTGRLYLLPAGPIDEAQIVVSMVEAPLLRLLKTRFVHIVGLVFEYGRGGAVEIRGGTDNMLAGCTIRNLGGGAVSIGPAETQRDGQLRVETGDDLTDGRRNLVRSCDIYNVGTSGISIVGGDRRTLAPCDHAAVNNDIHHYSRRKRTNCPAVGLSGVGIRAAHNFVHDAPHVGMNYGGNDHIIEYNELARLCWETGDVGAIYTGRNWTHRGNLVRHNFIHHTIAPGQVGSMGVYLDDSHSSTDIIGNVFYRNDYAAFIGGGRDNRVLNNVFIDCRKSVHLDNRSQGWAHKYQKPGGDHRMYAKLEEIRHDRPPYSERYPPLARILDENPHEPRGNQVQRNLCVRGRWLHVFQDGEQYLDLKDNLVTDEDPGFEDPGAMDFALQDNAAVFTAIPGFQAIPFDQIGLQVDAYRPSLPPRAPRIEPAGQAFSDALTVSLRVEPEDYDIRYTLDGTEPTPASTLYTGPFVLQQSADVCAAAFVQGDAAALPSSISSARFSRVEFGEGKGVFLSDLKAEAAAANGGLILDRNYRRNDFITMSGAVFRKGVLIHPESGAGKENASHVVYALEPPLDQATHFKAVIGIDDGGDQRGSVVFCVDLYKNGVWKTAFESPVLYGRPRAEQMTLDIPLDGAAKIRLRCQGGENNYADHAAWGNARLE